MRNYQLYFLFFLVNINILSLFGYQFFSKNLKLQRKIGPRRLTYVQAKVAHGIDDERNISALGQRTWLFLASVIGAGVLVDLIAGTPYAYNSVPRGVPVVHADSTGKLSTKLTARKRYLPRIAEGVKQFNALLRGDDTAVATFLLGEKPGYEGFVRAMNLFGASLRVGETPDKVSREAEKIVAAFNKEMIKAASSKNAPNKDDLREAASLLKSYINFAEQHVASPIDHYEVEL